MTSILAKHTALPENVHNMKSYFGFIYSLELTLFSLQATLTVVGLIYNSVFPNTLLLQIMHVFLWFFALTISQGITDMVFMQTYGILISVCIIADGAANVWRIITFSSIDGMTWVEIAAGSAICVCGCLLFVVSIVNLVILLYYMYEVSKYEAELDKRYFVKDKTEEKKKN